MRLDTVRSERDRDRERKREMLTEVSFGCTEYRWCLFLCSVHRILSLIVTDQVSFLHVIGVDYVT